MHLGEKALGGVYEHHLTKQAQCWAGVGFSMRLHHWDDAAVETL